MFLHVLSPPSGTLLAHTCTNYDRHAIINFNDLYSRLNITIQAVGVWIIYLPEHNNNINGRMNEWMDECR